MSRSNIRAIIFDIGRVLVRIDVARAMKRLAHGISLSPAELWTALEKDPRWPDWQEGRLSPREWHLHVSTRLGAKPTYEEFTECWNLALDPQPIHEEAFLTRLSENYRLALLSNTDPIHVSHIESNYSFVRLFPRRIYSCSVGFSKPDPLIYREALRACKVKAEEAVYVDDIPAYVEAAQKLGLMGIVFRSPEQLLVDRRISAFQRNRLTTSKTSTGQIIPCSPYVRVKISRTSTHLYSASPCKPLMFLGLREVNIRTDWLVECLLLHQCPITAACLHEG
jgi:glucose-1-phosphatase